MPGHEVREVRRGHPGDIVQCILLLHEVTVFSSGVAGPAAGGGGRLCLPPSPPLAPGAPRPRPRAPPRRGLRQLERGRELEPAPLRPPWLGHTGARGDQQGRGRGAEEEDVRDHLQQSSLVRSAAGVLAILVIWF